MRPSSRRTAMRFSSTSSRASHKSTGCGRRSCPSPSRPRPGLAATRTCSLHDETGTNVCADSSGTLGLSTTARHFVAGVLEEASALSSSANPTVNSYKRLNASWNQFGLDVVAGRGDVVREQPVRAYTRAGRERNSRVRLADSAANRAAARGPRRGGPRGPRGGRGAAAAGRRQSLRGRAGDGGALPRYVDGRSLTPSTPTLSP